MSKLDLDNNKENAFLVPDGIIVIDKFQKIIAFSEAAERITGYRENDIIFKSIDLIFNHNAEYLQIINESLNKGTTLSNLSMTVLCANGKTLNLLVSITSVEQPSHGIIGLILVFRNIHEMLLLFNELNEKNFELLNEKNKLEAIFNSRIEGTYTVNTNWEITSFNKAAENITGYSRDEAIGKKCWDIFHSNKCKEGCHMELTLKEMRPSASSEHIIINKDGNKVPVRVNTAPLFNGAGEQIGAVETFQDISEIKNLFSHLEERFHFPNIIGHSKAMQRIYELMENVIQSDSTVLVTGESGTGKEIIARAIHLNSERKSAPFMAINCSAFAETLLESELFGHEKGAFTGAIKTKPGRFELAGEGTLFLDEIGDLTLPTQVKLLRVLETRQFERVGGTETLQLKARLITATNKKLENEIKANRFREDLYYRINVINIHIPSLRERIDDIPLLIQHFLEKHKNKTNKDFLSMSPSALHLLQNYNWPGNIRELENALEHAFVVCHGEIIEIEHLPERLWHTNDNARQLSEKETIKAPLKNAERKFIQDILNKFNGNRGKAAEALGITRTTLWRKMKKYGIE